MKSYDKIGATANAFNRFATSSNHALGPLRSLLTANKWIGNTGYNLIVVPNPQSGFLVMTNQLFESQEFTSISAPVPNRSGSLGTEQNGAVMYVQTVAENESKNILHEETGMWMNQTLGTMENDPSGNGLQMVSGEQAIKEVTTLPIVRSASIPHGSTVHATGICQQYLKIKKGSNLLPFIAKENFQLGKGNISFLPTFADGSYTNELHAAYIGQIQASLKRIGQSRLDPLYFINPISLLNKEVSTITIHEINALAVTTLRNQGAVINTPFESSYAGPQSFSCTYLIETIHNPAYSHSNAEKEEKSTTYFQIQYLQSSPLLIPKCFNGRDVIFPHWNLNTLIAI